MMKLEARKVTLQNFQVMGKGPHVGSEGGNRDAVRCEGRWTGFACPEGQGIYASFLSSQLHPGFKMICSEILPNKKNKGLLVVQPG